MSAASAVPALLAAALLLDPAPLLPVTRLRALAPARPQATAWRRLVDRTPAGLVAMAAGTLAAVLAGLPEGIPLGLLAAGAAYAGTRLLLRKRSKADRGRGTTALRLAASWDMLAACLRAGLPVPVAIRAVAPQAPEPAGTALRQTADLLALGADPLTAWEPSVSCAETTRLARGARRAARSGSALADVADSLATEVRAAAGDSAESSAQRAAVLITGPLGLCFLPAFLCLGVVPVVIGLAGKLLASW